jgi:hypothetical protein
MLGRSSRDTVLPYYPVPYRTVPYRRLAAVGCRAERRKKKLFELVFDSCAQTVLSVVPVAFLGVALHTPTHTPPHGPHDHFLSARADFLEQAIHTSNPIHTKETCHEAIIEWHHH